MIEKLFASANNHGLEFQSDEVSFRRDGRLAVACKLTRPLMRFLFRWFEFANLVTVQRAHDADAREHRRAAACYQVRACMASCHSGANCSALGSLVMYVPASLRVTHPYGLLRDASVCLSGKTGSNRRRAKATRMTHNRPRHLLWAGLKLRKVIRDREPWRFACNVNVEQRSNTMDVVACTSRTDRVTFERSVR